MRRPFVFLWEHRLYFWITVAALVWIAYQFHTTQRRDPYDRINLAIAGIAYIIGGFVQLAFTRDWPARTVGVLFTALGTGTLYIALAVWRSAPEWLIDISRSLLNIGGPLFMLGIIAWAIHESRAARRPDLPNGMPDRRGGEPGRRSADKRNADIAEKYGVE